MRFRVSAKDLIIFIIFCIALLILSSLAVLNVTSLLTSTEFYGLNFFMGFTKDYIAATLIVFAAVLISIFYSVSSYIFEREKGKGIGLKIGEKDEKGGWIRKRLSDKHGQWTGKDLTFGNKIFNALKNK